MMELDEAQILEPLRLRGGNREDDGARQRRIAVAIDRDRPLGQRFLIQPDRIGRGGEGRLGRELQLIVVGDDTFAEGDRGDVPLPHRAQAHQDALRSGRHARLVEMWHRARVHQRGGSIAIFVAEIGTDQLALFIANLAAVDAEHVLDLVIARHEHAARLPVARLEILKHQLELGAGLGTVERHHRADDALRAIAAIAAPGEVKRPHHDPRWVGMEP